MESTKSKFIFSVFKSTKNQQNYFCKDFCTSLYKGWIKQIKELYFFLITYLKIILLGAFLIQILFMG